MTELEFAFQDVLDELDAVSLVAEPFIAPESQRVLAELKSGLKSFASEATARSFDWGIPAEIAMWRMEVGDARSPGCHFHVQVLGEAEVAPFPKSLSVPRLPAVHSTPPAVIEFVLGELFQATWDKHVAARSVHVKRWA